MTKDFLKDMVKYLPAQIVPGIVGFISIPIVTRLFSPIDYGNYSLVMATVMVLTTILGWLPTGIIRFYPVYQRRKKLDLFFGNTIKLTLISILVVTAIYGIVLFSAKPYFSSGLYLLMYICIGVFVLTGLFNVLQYFLRVKRQINWYSGFIIWRNLAGFGLGLGLVVLFDLGIEGLLWGIIISIILILPLLWRISIGSFFIIRTKVKPSLVKEMAKYSFPLVVGNLAAWILNLSDRFVLEFLRGSQEVGIYSASYNISDRSVMLIVSLFMLASGPISMHIWEKEGEARSKEFVTRLTRYYLMICIPLVVGLSVLSKPVMSILTGEEYFEGHKIIPFVATGIFFLGLQHRFQAGFLFYKKTGFITLSIVAAGLLNLGLNLLLVPQYGYIAAAITTLISYLFLLTLMAFMSRKVFVWEFPLNSLVKVSSVSAIMGIVVYFIGSNSSSLTLINLLLIICLGVFIYFAMLFLFREFQPKEKEAMKQIIAKCLPPGFITHK